MMNDGVPMNEDKCQQVLWNLMELISGPSDGVPASSVIRELMQTVRCDAILEEPASANMASLRAKYKNALGADAWNLVMQRKEGVYEPQERLAIDTIIHYRTYTRVLLVSCFSPAKKFEYYTVHKAESTLATMGLFGTGYAVTRGVRGIAKASVEAMKKM
jgi:hypothetical protein